LLFNRLFEKTTSSSSAPDAPCHYTTFTDDERAATKGKIREVLKNVVDKVQDPQVFGQAACDRVAFLQARMELDDIFRMDSELAVPPAVPDKIGMVEKAARALSLSKKEMKSDETQQIKDQLRKGDLSAEDAKSKLTKLQEDSEALKDDRRSEKIEFLIAATKFREALEQKADRLPDVIKKAPKGCWSTEIANSLMKPLRATVEVWEKRVAKDKETAALLQKAWEKFQKAAGAA
jgi:hypothetical protein